MRAFKSDGCSGGVSLFFRAWGLKGQPMEACCENHDRDYYQGGTRAKRLKADQALSQCWQVRGVPKLTAKIGFWAIRLFGGPLFPAPWRWSFKDPLYRRRYRRP